MAVAPHTPETLNPAQTWRPLRLFNLYRLILSGFFVVLTLSDLNLNPIGEYNAQLFSTTAILYLLINIVSSFTIRWRYPSFTTQVYSQALIDIFAITLLMHASGGATSGLGMLLIIAVAGGSMLLAGRTALSLAAIATLFILGEHLYFQFDNPHLPTAYTHTGLLGATFFVTALLARALAGRIRESEALAAKRGVDLANMAQLAKYVIQRMQTGVVVVDSAGRLWQINDSARQLLGLSPLTDNPPLEQTCPPLAEQYQRWLAEPDYRPQPFHTTIAELLPRFATLGDESSTLIFIEDTTAMMQQAQQLKLASLGRLSGSIAHEIRNPLGAISHAGQLLAESPQLDKHDLRLTEIIHDNSQRMNKIIENVLQLGRRRQSAPETVQLKPWLENFVDELCRNQQLAPDQIHLSVEPETLETEFDASQLHQILWNLCTNGIRHGSEHTGLARLTLRAAATHDNPTPYLDIIDNGPGISADTLQQIFEPFFTTATQGSGLGLYIARELSECNHAHLTYLPATDGGSCFRLTFSDPRRRRTH
jgi:two-component system sensor histidine kinase PilS (NtrC family)